MTAIVGHHLDVEGFAGDFVAFHVQRCRTDVESAFLIGLQGIGIGVFDGVRHRTVDHREA